MAKHDSDFTHTMAASTMLEGIIDQVRSSNLNYQIQMTPSSVKLKLEVEFDFGKLDAVMHKLKLLLSLSNWVSFALSFCPPTGHKAAGPVTRPHTTGHTCN